ncbi:unnamed protein product [Miscanthus lutarioriparius]|uniref:Uncharacterized protein n=1 Tax=Miscanthus lutarioriparius TaxID=422564 RepID=A0A811PKN7_9POAL|nr:unnamed protein product [Miscanthus lutarioriparius]
MRRDGKLIRCLVHEKGKCGVEGKGKCGPLISPILSRREAWVVPGYCPPVCSAFGVLSPETRCRRRRTHLAGVRQTVGARAPSTRGATGTALLARCRTNFTRLLDAPVGQASGRCLVCPRGASLVENPAEGMSGVDGGGDEVADGGAALERGGVKPAQGWSGQARPRRATASYGRSSAGRGRVVAKGAGAGAVWRGYAGADLRNVRWRVITHDTSDVANEGHNLWPEHEEEPGVQGNLPYLFSNNGELQIQQFEALLTFWISLNKLYCF